jgi:hypothetical protein
MSEIVKIWQNPEESFKISTIPHQGWKELSFFRDEIRWNSRDFLWEDPTPNTPNTPSTQRRLGWKPKKLEQPVWELYDLVENKYIGIDEVPDYKWLKLHDAWYLFDESDRRIKDENNNDIHFSLTEKHPCKSIDQNKKCMEFVPEDVHKPTETPTTPTLNVPQYKWQRLEEGWVLFEKKESGYKRNGIQIAIDSTTQSPDFNPCTISSIKKTKKSCVVGGKSRRHNMRRRNKYTRRK